MTHTGWMHGLLVAALIIIPFAELVVLVKSADAIGILPTILLLVAVSIAGTYFLAREGSSTWRRLRAAIGRGDVPTDELVTGAMILFAGALLLTPGFITDVLAFTLLIPGTRKLWKRGFRAAFGWLVFRRAGAVGRAGVAGRRVYETRVTRVRRESEAGRGEDASADATRSSRRPGALPVRGRPGAEGGSPDRG